MCVACFVLLCVLSCLMRVVRVLLVCCLLSLLLFRRCRFLFVVCRLLSVAWSSLLLLGDCLLVVSVDVFVLLWFGGWCCRLLCVGVC